LPWSLSLPEAVRALACPLAWSVAHIGYYYGLYAMLCQCQGYASPVPTRATGDNGNFAIQ